MNNNKPFKFHWGHGIILTFVLFGAFMAYFYIQMTHQVIELVGDNYYEDGQKFQKSGARFDRVGLCGQCRRAEPGDT